LLGYLEADNACRYLLFCSCRIILTWNSCKKVTDDWLNTGYMASGSPEGAAFGRPGTEFEVIVREYPETYTGTLKEKK
jgi:hypothetical protein